MYGSLSANNLLSQNQSGFRSADSCINQFLSNHEILNAFDKAFKFVGYFLIFQRLLTKYVIMALFLNYIKMVWVEISLTFYETFIATEDKELFWTVSVHLWSMFVLLFLKNQSLNVCFSWYTLTTYLMVLKVNMNYLPMTLLYFPWSDCNEDLQKISNWAFQWKIYFSPDPIKFSRNYT